MQEYCEQCKKYRDEVERLQNQLAGIELTEYIKNTKKLYEERDTLAGALRKIRNRLGPYDSFKKPSKDDNYIYNTIDIALLYLQAEEPELESGKVK